LESEYIYYQVYGVGTDDPTGINVFPKGRRALRRGPRILSLEKIGSQSR